MSCAVPRHMHQEEHNLKAWPHGRRDGTGTLAPARQQVMAVTSRMRSHLVRSRTLPSERDASKLHGRAACTITDTAASQPPTSLYKLPLNYVLHPSVALCARPSTISHDDVTADIETPSFFNTTGTLPHVQWLSARTAALCALRTGTEWRLG